MYTLTEPAVEVINEQNDDCHSRVPLGRLQERDKESESLKQQLEAAKSVISKRRQQVEQLKLMHLELAGRCEKVAATLASACVRYGMVWCGLVLYGMVWCGVVWYGMVVVVCVCN